MHPVGRHAIGRSYGTQRHAALVRTLIAHYADALHGQQNRSRLPYLVVKSPLAQGIDIDFVHILQNFHLLRGNIAQNTDRKARTGERMPPQQLRIDTEGLTHAAHLVLKEQAQRLDDFQVHLFGQAADVVVALDGAGFENVGVDGALGEEVDAVELLGLFGKDVDEFLADDLALRLRVGHAGQLVEEAVDRVYIDEVRAKLFAENLDNLLRLALAEQTMVDMDADELLADRLDEQRRDDGAVDAAGQGEQDVLVADLRAKRGELFFDERLRKLRRGDTLHGFRTFVVHSSSQKSENSPVM